jgi:hypothetical protein
MSVFSVASRREEKLGLTRATVPGTSKYVPYRYVEYPWIRDYIESPVNESQSLRHISFWFGLEESSYIPSSVVRRLLG